MSSTKSNWANASSSTMTSAFPHRSLPLNTHRSGRLSKSSISTRTVHTRSFSSDPFISPLDQIKKHHRTAHHSPHLRRATPTDIIDSLDNTSLSSGPYHHEGPYDATLASRQIPGRSPVEALKYSNAQTLAATPRANIIDSLEKKVPLQGIGMVPSGMIGPGGQKFEYEVDDIERSQGGLGRWPGVEYLPSDYKGKGEPSFTLEEREKALKAQQKHEKNLQQQGLGNGYEYRAETHTLTTIDSHGRKRSVSDVSGAQYPYRMNPSEADNSGGMLGGLRKKLSLRRRKK